MIVAEIILEAGEPKNPSRRGFMKKLGAAAIAAAMPSAAFPKPEDEYHDDEQNLNIELDDYDDYDEYEHENIETIIGTTPRGISYVGEINYDTGVARYYYETPQGEQSFEIYYSGSYEEVGDATDPKLKNVDLNKLAKFLAKDPDYDRDRGWEEDIIDRINDPKFIKKFMKQSATSAAKDVASATTPLDIARLAGIAKKGIDVVSQKDEPVAQQPITKPLSLPKPEKPEFDLTPDLNKKQKEPVRKKDSDES